MGCPDMHEARVSLGPCTHNSDNLVGNCRGTREEDVSSEPRLYTSDQSTGQASHGSKRAFRGSSNSFSLLSITRGEVRLKGHCYKARWPLSMAGQAATVGTQISQKVVDGQREKDRGADTR